MNTFSEWFQTTLGLSPELQEKLLTSAFAIISLWLLRELLVKLALQRVTDLRVRYQWQKTSGYVMLALGILLVGRVWFNGFQDIATFLGLLSAGLAIALGDLVTNVVAWVFILWRRPFEVGDRIQIGAHAGDVIDQRIFQFTLMEIGNWVEADQSTGRIVHIPNGKVFKEVLANYTLLEYIWNEIPVAVTFESNWQKAKAILQAIADEHTDNLSQSAKQNFERAARKFMIVQPKLTPIVYTSVKDHGVLLTIRYLCQPRRRRGSSHAIWEAILQAFNQRIDIELAYPTQRLYYYPQESKARTEYNGMPNASKTEVVEHEAD
ncbi:MAG TPA: mechanosensitive ion channel family protein [Candidatus Caenarcaniphilales bacterium]